MDRTFNPLTYLYFAAAKRINCAVVCALERALQSTNPCGEARNRNKVTPDSLAHPFGGASPIFAQNLIKFDGRTSVKCLGIQGIAHDAFFRRCILRGVASSRTCSRSGGNQAKPTRECVSNVSLTRWGASSLVRLPPRRHAAPAPVLRATKF